MNIDPRLVDAAKAKKLMLFVGAGVSSSIGLPSWRELLGIMATELRFDVDIFDGYGDALLLAEYYWLQKRSLGPLSSRMNREWHCNPEKVTTSEIHNAILKLGCPIIYTTNFDSWLETAYEKSGRPYLKITNVGDFSNISKDATQIVKLHGDFDDPATLVLTESSYFERFSFESPLDIKLRSDSIGNSILFVGYSLSDPNVRYLTYKLHCMWTGRYAPMRPLSFMFLGRPNIVQESVLESRGIIPIVSESDQMTANLATFLLELANQALAGR